jgi:hypothetical protein
VFLKIQDWVMSEGDKNRMVVRENVEKPGGSDMRMRGLFSSKDGAGRAAGFGILWTRDGALVGRGGTSVVAPRSNILGSMMYLRSRRNYLWR